MFVVIAINVVKGHMYLTPVITYSLLYEQTKQKTNSTVLPVYSFESPPPPRILFLLEYLKEDCGEKLLLCSH